MKKLLSIVLVVTMSICSFGSVSCFADPPTSDLPEENTQQIAATKVESKNLHQAQNFTAVSELRNMGRDMVNGGYKALKTTAKTGTCCGAVIGFYVGIITGESLSFGLLCAITGAVSGCIGTILTLGWLPVIIGALAAI